MPPATAVDRMPRNPNPSSQSKPQPMSSSEHNDLPRRNDKVHDESRREALLAIKAGLAAMAAALVEPSNAASAPTPKSAPPPARPPAKPTLPAPLPGEITTERVLVQRLLMLDSMHNTTNAYERRQNLHIHTNPGALVVQLWNLAAGGVRMDLPAGVYTLMVDGIARTSVTGSGRSISFSNLTLAPGWRRIVVTGPGGLCSPSWFVHSGVAAVDTLVPVCTGTYEIIHSVTKIVPGVDALGVHKYTWVPVSSAPNPQPLSQRVAPYFSTKLAPNQMYRRMLVAQTTSQRIYRKGAVATSFGAQSYHFSDLIRQYPTCPLLDGPRGVGTLNMVTHVHIGTATKKADVASGPVGALYVTDPWRLVRVNADGSVRTLVGYRHDTTPYWGDAVTTQPPLVGDWSRVQGPRGLWECWGFTFDAKSLGLDMARPPNTDGRHFHAGNPTGYLADTRHDRVLKVVFDGRSHETPAIITEHLRGLSDPWRVVIDPVRRWLIVSERTLHRVSVWDVETGALVKVVLQGQNLATIDPGRSARRTVSLEACRTAQIVSPEGMALRGDWLYVGSLPQQQVRRVHLVTGAVEVVANLPNDGNMRFVDVAVSDGTTGPEGTVFVSTWSNARMGSPMAFLPDGTQWYLDAYASTAAHSGRSPWQVLGYSSGVACGAGRIVFGSSDWGLHELTKVADRDPVPRPALLAEGAAALDSLHYGPGGISPWGLPSPRGRSAAIDHLLDINETA